MSKKKIYIYSSLCVVLFFGWIFSDSNQKNEDFAERVKVSLRDAGNQLLLSNQDSTSLVLPIIELSSYKFKLSFQHQLSFEPSFLVEIVKNSFKKNKLHNYYRVEVKQCVDGEVAYSYEMKNELERNIIPCKGRVLPQNCYTIEVKFTNTTSLYLDKQFFLFALLFMMLVFIIDATFLRQKAVKKEVNTVQDAINIGSYQFYPEQNKLVMQATEIRLSKKECELLTIFVSRPNEIIKREELTKKVWEDNGVFVGRSLDTYISKLRKKIKGDDTIKISNVHGVGYKLELK
ncbi:MAG: winged helix-turn-helix transcriptional regulator [Flavobacteriaceae bacterium]|nr:winged helix-turn-helix transcriptional regulator [Flavobacteriaceae bacterium]